MAQKSISTSFQVRAAPKSVSKYTTIAWYVKGDKKCFIQLGELQLKYREIK